MQKLDHLGWVVHQSYEIGGTRFQIRTTSKAFGRWLGSTLSRYRVKGSAEPFYSIVVDDSAGGRKNGSTKRFHILYRGTSQVVRTLDLALVGRTLLSELETLQCGQRDDATYLEAGVVSMDGKTALVSGPLVAYLGGAARHAVRAGLLLPATRSLAIEPESGRVGPVRPQLTYPQDAALQLTQIAPTGESPERAFLEDPVKVDAVFTYVALADEPVQSVPRGQALHYFAANIMNFGMMHGEALESLGRLVQAAQCYQLADAPALKVVRSLAATLQSSSSS